MNTIVATEPAWQALYDVAAAQEGLFTTRQAATAGYSPPLLTHHQKAGRIVRIRRGIYRLVHFPPGEHEELVTAWLWTDAQGVLSHETALSLHGFTQLYHATNSSGSMRCPSPPFAEPCVIALSLASRPTCSAKLRGRHCAAGWRQNRN